MTDYKTMPSDARVWIFQADREFSSSELADLKLQIQNFVEQWTSHKKMLNASAGTFYNRFIVFFIDESKVTTGGCSMDTLMNFIKSVENLCKVSLLDRMLVAYRLEGQLLSAKLNEFEQLLAQNKINENTIVFNNLVSTKAEFETIWETPIKNSWHNRLLVA